jgi:hypothetical protein
MVTNDKAPYWHKQLWQDFIELNEKRLPFIGADTTTPARQGKAMKRVSADVGLIFVAYNLRRIMNLIGPQKQRQLFHLLIFVFGLLAAFFKAISRYNFFKQIKA